MIRLCAWLAAALLLAFQASAQTVSIVAAENVYADVGRQIAGTRASVASVLKNPDADPHLFEPSASVAREVARARLVVMNGADYDPWMARLIAAQPDPARVVIDVGALVHAPEDANPHLWYDPAAMVAYARTLAADLARLDPAGARDYAAHLQGFLGSMAPLDRKVAEMRERWGGAAVTATEPVFGYMAAALGLLMQNQRFQLAVMNGTEPSARDTAAFEHDLRSRAVRVLIYNRQATDPAAERLLAIAKEAGVPTVGVTETEPAGKSYQQWMLAELDALGAALAH